MGVAAAPLVMLDPSIGQVVTRAERYLATARLALDDGDPESVASRSYYALYHATILLLGVVRGITRERWDHDELHRMFLEEFCKRGFLFNADDAADRRRSWKLGSRPTMLLARSTPGGRKGR